MRNVKFGVSFAVVAILAGCTSISNDNLNQAQERRLETSPDMLSSIVRVRTGSNPERAEADVDTQHPIQLLEDAYNREKLLALDSITIKSDRRLAWPGQSQTAEFVEFGADRMIRYLDFEKAVGSVERWTHQSGNFYHNRYLADTARETVIDYATGFFTVNENSSYPNAFLGDMRSSDILLARFIMMSPEAVTRVSDGHYLGHESYIMDVEMAPEAPVVTAYVSKQDGLIRRVQMDRAFGKVNILFGSHHSSDGLTWATESQIFINDRLTEYEADIRLTTNRPRPDLLVRDKNLRLQPEMVDLSEMTVDVVGDGRYIVGQDDYSYFIEHEGAYIAVNTYTGFSDRYEALIEHTGRDLPLSFAIATHHHTEQLDGLARSAELGAVLLMTSDSNSILMADDANNEIVEKAQIVKDRTAIGPLILYVKPTSHAVQNIFIHDTETGYLFQDNHYHGLRKEGPSRIQPTAFELDNIIKSLGINVTGFISGHARKIETWQVFQEGVRKQAPSSMCPSGRPICKPGFPDD